MLTSEEALVGAVNNECVFRKAMRVKPVKNPANVIINCRNAAEIVFHETLILVPIESPPLQHTLCQKSSIVFVLRIVRLMERHPLRVCHSSQKLIRMLSIVVFTQWGRNIQHMLGHAKKPHPTFFCIRRTSFVGIEKRYRLSNLVSVKHVHMSWWWDTMNMR